jgi:hypothetical protein
VQLNVGGTLFTTSWSTLTAQDDSFFSGVYRQREACGAMDEPGPIFVDRDPTLFKSVLGYLRTGHVEVPPSIGALKVSRMLTHRVSRVWVGFGSGPSQRAAEGAERRWTVVRRAPCG